MPVVYDAKTGKPLRLAPDQATEALRSGLAVLPAGSKINVVDSKGSVYQVPATDLGAELEAGSRLESEQEAHVREVERRQEGKEIEAFLLGIGRTATFGGTDVLGALGGQAQTISEIGEAHPDATLGGEIIGAVGPMLVPGGAAKTILGKGLQAAAAPVKGVARIGRAVEEGVQGLLGPAAGKGILRQGLEAGASTGAGAAVEGGLYGGGQYISEVALGQIDPSAENLIDHVGLGAVLGGGMGTALGGAMKTAGTAARQGSARARRWFADKWSQQTGQPLLEGVKDAFAGAAGLVTGKGKAAVKGLMTPEAKLAIEGGEQARFGLAKKQTAIENELLDIEDDLFWRNTGSRKDEWVDVLAREGGDLEASRAAMLEKLETQRLGVQAMKDAKPGSFGFLNDQDKLLKRIEVAKERVTGASTLGDIFNEGDLFKQDLQKLATRATRSTSAPGSVSSEVDAAAEFRRMADDVRPMLEEDGLWGKQAASYQRESNEAWHEYLGDIRRRPDHRFTESYEGADFWATARKEVHHKEAGWQSYMDDLGTPKAAEDTPWLQSQRQKKERLLDALVKGRKLDPEDVAKLDRWKVLRREADDNLREAEFTIGKQNQIRELEQAASATGFDAGTGAIVGAAFGGLPGALIGLAAGAVSNPAKTLRQLMTLDRVIGAQRGRISSAVGRYVERVKAAGAAAGRGAKRLAGPTAVILSREDRVRQYERDLAAYSQALGDQGVDRLARSAEEIVAAPNLAAAMARKAAGAATYALAQAPKPTKEPPTWSKAKYQPTDDELDRWSQVNRALQHPSTIIEDLAGGYVSRAAVDAVRTAYPEVYLQIVEELQDRLAESELDLPYEERVQLTVLFDVPAEPTATPEAIAAWQDGYAPTPEQQMAAGGGMQPRKLPVGRLTKPEAQLTEAQRLEAKA